MGNAPSALAPLLVDRLEAARLLGVSPGTVDNLRNRGELPSVKLFGRRLFDVSDLVRLIAHKKERQGCPDEAVPLENGTNVNAAHALNHEPGFIQESSGGEA